MDHLRVVQHVPFRKCCPFWKKSQPCLIFWQINLEFWVDSLHFFEPPFQTWGVNSGLKIWCPVGCPISMRFLFFFCIVTRDRCCFGSSDFGSDFIKVLPFFTFTSLKIPPCKRRNIDPNHWIFWFQPFVFGGVSGCDSCFLFRHLSESMTFFGVLTSFDTIRSFFWTKICVFESFGKKHLDVFWILCWKTVPPCRGVFGGISRLQLLGLLLFIRLRGTK